VFLIGVEEVGSPEVVVGLDERFRLETDECHARLLQVFYLVHVLLGYLDFLAPQRIVSPHNAVEKNLAF